MDPHKHDDDHHSRRLNEIILVPSPLTRFDNQQSSPFQIVQLEGVGLPFPNVPAEGLRYFDTIIWHDKRGGSVCPIPGIVAFLSDDLFSRPGTHLCQ